MNSSPIHPCLDDRADPVHRDVEVCLEILTTIPDEQEEMFENHSAERQRNAHPEHFRETRGTGGGTGFDEVSPLRPVPSQGLDDQRELASWLCFDDVRNGAPPAKPPAVPGPKTIRSQPLRTSRLWTPLRDS